MIELICENLRNVITTNVAYADRVAGLIREAVERKEYGERNPETGEFEVYKVEEIRFPVAQNVTRAQCFAGTYKDLAPDTSKKNVIYFERMTDDTRIDTGDKRVQMAAKFRMVVWLNLKKLGFTDELGLGNETYLYQIRNELAALCTNTPATFTIGTSTIVKADVKLNGFGYGSEILTKWSYEKHIIENMLLYPYNYFSINFTASWYVGNCDKFIPQTEIC